MLISSKYSCKYWKNVPTIHVDWESFIIIIGKFDHPTVKSWADELASKRNATT